MNLEEEKKKCYHCNQKPCVKGCPLGNEIPAMIQEQDEKKAFENLCETTVLPAICGRICPHSKQCQGSCSRGIKQEPVSIGRIEAGIGDFSLKEGIKIPQTIPAIMGKIENKEVEALKGKRVAIIGGGAAGLTAAAFLARTGIGVDIYEKHDCLRRNFDSWNSRISFAKRSSRTDDSKYFRNWKY